MEKKFHKVHIQHWNGTWVVPSNDNDYLLIPVVEGLTVIECAQKAGIKLPYIWWVD